MISFRCAREGFETGATQLLGGFDGRDRREVHLYATSIRPEQLLVSMHEHLHHELHWSTGWGLVSAMAGLLSEADATSNVHRQRLRAVAAAANSTCRTVHEIFATTISAGAIGVLHSRQLLAGNSEYLAHLDNGVGLAGPTGTWPWQFRESASQMLLRALMQPAEVADIAERGFDRLRLRDVASAECQPDYRLGLVLAEAGQWWHATFEELIRDHPDRGGDRGGVWSRELPEDAADMEQLKAWEETVLIPTLQGTATRHLRRHGLAVLDQDAYLQVTTALRDSFAQLAPEDWQTELVVGSRAMTQEPLGAEREALVLHATPARLEAFSSEDLTAHATTFLFDPAEGRRHVLATWLPARVLARQLRGFVGDPFAEGPILALAGRPHLGDAGERIVPLAFMRPDVALADLVAMFSSLPTAVLTSLTVTAEQTTSQRSSPSTRCSCSSTCRCGCRSTDGSPVGGPSASGSSS
jgi:hypothetical protein